MSQSNNCYHYSTYVPPQKTYKRIFIRDFRFSPPRHLYNNHQRAMLRTWSLSSCFPPAPLATFKDNARFKAGSGPFSN